MHDNPIYRPYGAFEMKQTYQRNLIVANVLVLALTLLIGGTVWLSHWLDHQDMVTVTPQDVDRTVHVMMAMMEPPKPVKRYVRAPEPVKPRDLGLFDQIRAHPDAPEPMPVDTTLVRSDTSASAGDSIQSYSDLLGDTGIGIYPPTHLSPDASVEPEVIPCSVMVAVPPEYPWVAREGKKEGAAGIIVCIDESGKVSLFPDTIVKEFQAKNLSVEKMTFKVDGQKRSFNYVVTLEAPEGWFFAKKVAEILPKWTFEPSTLNGQPVKSLLPIGHAFCLTSDCTYEYAVLRNYKHYSSAMTR